MTLVVAALVLAVVAGLTVVAWTDGRLNDLICDDGECGASALSTPDAMDRGTTPAAATVPAAADARVDADAVEKAVRSALADDALGEHVGFAAVDPVTRAVAGSVGSGGFVPASTTKLLTGLAALTELDPQSRFATRVVSSGDRIVLVGGGDPYLATKRPKKPVYAMKADLTTLAKRTAAALKKDGRTSVRLGYDASLFTGPGASPAWESDYVSADIVTRVSALWADQGVEGGGRVDDPAAAAARTFARLLGDRGIDVTGDVTETEAGGDTLVAQVRSATVARIVESMITHSDNQAAEVLLRHVGAAAGGKASFEGGAAAVKKVLERLDVDTSDLVLTDGSGLSRKNRISPTTLAETVAAAMTSPRTAGLAADLAVGGFTGTLKGRFDTAKDGRGAVRGKSGTLTGVHSLAGYVTDRTGTPIVFAVMTDRTSAINGFVTQAALDRVAAALAKCSCSGG
ncbi:D-alanyl-D-alanine carboxypeptidase/D-alanyl-D-alanine endopeptidase [Aeromicrobium terrae]|uniref:D-alanyl-D-alanine carboxypeptidase/D-alanyl-D-alanine-endopeptidase n=1 Tax=Aeromicrobium terrae TaxID=2498846 RepID=A0A5C8NH51_9ACTN|nr:D-alanyl-D-alanine carboxypeptidase/D-alanyl-D-alanine-endopeptidase [Aeromicrobium terrae]TXL57908.1 D-alanyl-D-alanine carboxypeptidase/D-alanyl-D-alanine-endopeptidase [Aeromicrobium terrae]